MLSCAHFSVVQSNSKVLISTPLIIPFKIQFLWKIQPLTSVSWDLQKMHSKQNVEHHLTVSFKLLLYGCTLKHTIREQAFCLFKICFFFAFHARLESGVLLVCLPDGDGCWTAAAGSQILLSVIGYSSSAPTAHHTHTHTHTHIK